MVRIRFNDLQINEITKASGVFSGDNLQVNWRSIRKSNEGFGFAEGDHNNFNDNHHTILDPDFIEKYYKTK